MRFRFVVVLLAACGGSGGGSASDASPAPAAPPPASAAPPVAPPAPAPIPAPHPPLPQVVSLGGKVIDSPRFVVVTYDGDPYRDQLEKFAADVGASKYWHDVTAEYGVGPAVVGRPVHLSEAAPALVDDQKGLKPWLESKLDGTHPEWDAPDGETIYVVYFPEGTTYTLDGWTGCHEFGASDNTLVRKDGSMVPYIAVPRCPSYPGLDAWQTLTAVSSHELFEEATDPYKDAFVTDDDDDIAWSATPPFSEIGDMCMADPKLWMQPADLPYTVQRAWSNAAARAGKNPCVPAGAWTYFAAAPVFDGVVPISFDKFQWKGQTRGVQIPVGQSKTIDVALFSEADTDAWKVLAYDLSALQGNPANLALTLDRATGKNGDVLKLTITPLRQTPEGGARFVLYSIRGTEGSFSIGWVGT